MRRAATAPCRSSAGRRRSTAGSPISRSSRAGAPTWSIWGEVREAKIARVVGAVAAEEKSAGRGVVHLRRVWENISRFATNAPCRQYSITVMFLLLAEGRQAASTRSFYWH